MADERDILDILDDPEISGEEVQAEPINIPANNEPDNLLNEVDKFITTPKKRVESLNLPEMKLKDVAMQTEDDVLDYNDENIDFESGAPLSERTLVGNAPNTESKLKTLLKLHPDATPYQENDGSINYLFTNPETGKKTVFNPDGMDLGDAAEYGRAATQMISGYATGALSSPTGPFAIPIGIGASLISGQLYDQALKFFGQEDTRTTTQKAIDAGVEGLTEAAFMGAGAGLGKILKGGTRKVLTKNTEFADNTLKAFDELGIPIEGAGGAITGSRPLSGLSDVSSNLPLSSSMMRKSLEKTIDGLDLSFQRTTRNVGKIFPNKEAAGREIAKGFNGFIDKTSAKASKLYEEIPIKNNSVVEASSFKKALEAPLKEFAEGSAISASEIGETLVNSDFKKWIGALSKSEGKLTWGQIKQLRSSIGDKLDNSFVDTSATKKTLSKLYASLSDDMEKHAIINNAFNKYSRANQFYAAKSKRQAMMNKIASSDEVEDAFGLLFSKAKNGTTKIRAARKSIPTDIWKDIVATKLRDMGQATGAEVGRDGFQFSIKNFTKNWGNLSGEAKKELFTGISDPVRKELDNLLVVQRSIKDANSMQNFSNTANSNFLGNMIMGGVFGQTVYTNPTIGGFAQAAAKLALPPAVTKVFLTNPKFIRFLATGAKIEPANFKGIAAHLSRLPSVLNRGEESAGKQFIEYIKKNFMPKKQEEIKIDLPSGSGRRIKK